MSQTSRNSAVNLASLRNLSPSVENDGSLLICLTNRRVIGYFAVKPLPERPIHPSPSKSVIGTSIANPFGTAGSASGVAMERVPMSTFDNPFDPRRRLNRSGCSCGRHVSQIEHDRDAATATAMRRRRERGEALRGRGRLRGDARGVPAGCRAPRLPEIGRRLDRARARCRSSSRSRPRPRCSRKAARSRRRTSRSASSRSPARRRSSWRSRWASIRSTASTSK